MNIYSQSNSSNKPILFFDSGIGGLPYAVQAREALPGEEIVYLADRLGFPYGTKPREEVTRFVVSAIGLAVRAFTPKVVVVACNTATEIAIQTLREHFPELPFIGTVPAVKPAAERTKTGKIAVIATNRAVAEPYLDDLAVKHASSCSLLKIGASPLVSWIEDELFQSDSQARSAVILPYIDQVRAFGADMLVLGCTHFLHLYEQFTEACQPEIAVIDSRDGITKRLANVLESQNLMSKRQILAQEHGFWVTGSEPVEKRYTMFSKESGFNFRGVLS